MVVSYSFLADARSVYVCPISYSLHIKPGGNIKKCHEAKLQSVQP